MLRSALSRGVSAIATSTVAPALTRVALPSVLHLIKKIDHSVANHVSKPKISKTTSAIARNKHVQMPLSATMHFFNGANQLNQSSAETTSVPSSTAERATKQKQNQIHRILLTGGPCAGKSTALSSLHQFLINHGFAVYTIPEASTLLQMQTGMKPNLATLPMFQKVLTKLQHTLEVSMYQYASDVHHEKPIVILIDRGIMDGNAYITNKSAFDKILKQALGEPMDKELDITQLIDSKYDMILHLVTAANGAEKFYANEEYRGESVEDARVLDERIQDIYKEHPDRRMVPNFATFDDKLQLSLGHVAHKLNIRPLTRKNLRFIVAMKDGSQDINEVIKQLQACTPQDEEPLVATYVIKYFLKQDDSKKQSEQLKKNVYTFIRETNVLNIKQGVNVYDQIKDIRERSLQPIAAQESWDDYEDTPIAIPNKAGSSWVHATHYMMIKNSDVDGQIINESENLTRRSYNELRKYSRDREKQGVEKIKLFFHYKNQFYSLDTYLKPDEHRGTMWLKVYRTPGNKYNRDGLSDAQKVDVPQCLELQQNVTNDPDFSSYVLSTE